MVRCETGDRVAWQHLPPGAMRKGAMKGIGARLRIDTGGPVRLRSTQDSDFMKGKTSINDDELYIGAGNLPLRQKASKWAPKPAVNGNTTEIDCLISQGNILMKTSCQM